eukprot:TRINITY_DN8113_c0_g1_i6.p1 TRINITY_DN8113_c0_g1~~TRINITY_DN8113_c0_g1_i6.p1  ORF type:complete len:364 (-),score=75.11 TRINITY_DN8113_c0_g1_i6:34-1044(-)
MCIRDRSKVHAFEILAKLEDTEELHLLEFAQYPATADFNIIEEHNIQIKDERSSIRTVASISQYKPLVDEGWSLVFHKGNQKVYRQRTLPLETTEQIEIALTQLDVLATSMLNDKYSHSFSIAAMRLRTNLAGIHNEMTAIEILVPSSVVSLRSYCKLRAAADLRLSAEEILYFIETLSKFLIFFKANRVFLHDFSLDNIVVLNDKELSFASLRSLERYAAGEEDIFQSHSLVAIADAALKSEENFTAPEVIPQPQGYSWSVAPEEANPFLCSLFSLASIMLAAIRIAASSPKQPTSSNRKEQHRCTQFLELYRTCLLYTSPSPRDGLLSRMPSSA